MDVVAFPGYIRCTFNPEKTAELKIIPHKTEVFFAHQQDFLTGYASLEKFINPDDQFKVERLKKRDDMSSLLACYTLLRLILSKRLKLKPEEISYFTHDRGKPGLINSSLDFNISHSGHSFAFAISENAGLGLDLEEHNKKLNYKAIVKRFFSAEEGNYIFDSPDQSSDRFFLLWTRKEALLKAFGTGIISDLSQVEVHKPVNQLNKNFLGEFTGITVSNDYYIYSLQCSGYYLSVALPQVSELILTPLNEEYIKNFLQ